jgi:hypothetical protein
VWQLVGTPHLGVSTGLACSAKLEEFYRDRNHSSQHPTLSINSFNYLYYLTDHSNLLQMNAKTGMVRQLKREPIKSQDSLPPWWTPMSEDMGTVLVPLDGTKEHTKVRHHFENSIGNTAARIIDVSLNIHQVNIY